MIPNAYYKSIFDIDYDKLKKKGYKYLFFDVDNTIISYKEDSVNKEILKLFKKLKKEFSVYIFSNGNSKRVLKIENELGILGYHFSMKPLKKNYKKVISVFNKDKCIFIGDQFMTDILGAYRNKLKVILVDPIDKSYEPITTRFWRKLENIHLNKLKKKGKFNIYNYYDKI